MNIHPCVKLEVSSICMVQSVESSNGRGVGMPLSLEHTKSNCELVLTSNPSTENAVVNWDVPTKGISYTLRHGLLPI